MRIALASDHAGFPLKKHLVAYLTQQGYEVIDLGVDNPDLPSDYPDAAEAVAMAIIEGRAERAILACGSGIGASIAANKFPGIYAAIAHDHYSAHQGVEHDQMNVLTIGARVIGEKIAEEVSDAFLAAQPSDEERHLRRFGKVQAIERRHTKTD
ncbi:MAG: ribose 5-phosphate isomerase B [Anaerolineae bacterium]